MPGDQVINASMAKKATAVNSTKALPETVKQSYETPSRMVKEIVTQIVTQILSWLLFKK